MRQATKPLPSKVSRQLLGASIIGGLLLAACSSDVGSGERTAAGGPAPGETGIADGTADPQSPGLPGANGAGERPGAEMSANPGSIEPTPGVQPGQPTPAEGTPTEGASASETAQRCAGLGEGIHTGATKLRRLTQAQYNNTVRDLLGVSGTPASAFGLDERIGPFQSNAIAAITPLLVQQHDEVALSLAEDAVEQMNTIAPCDLAAGGDACASQFVADFGLRAYRRPLDATEQDAYESLFQTGMQEGGIEEAFRLVVATFLTSPNFLYHVDVGVTGAPPSEPTLLSSYELASRLSYFLWNTMPDQELFVLAAQDTLQDDAVLNVQVERMLADEKAKDAIPYFHLQWLSINRMEGTSKDEAMFPQFDETLANAMLQETSDFADYVVREGDGLMSTLLSATFSFPQGPLFELYGVQQPPGFTPGTPVEMDPAQRSGILTQAAFLARHAHENQTSPVHRGMVIRENMLCTPIASPPPDVDNVPPQPTEATTTRERFAQHSSDPTCAGCHVLMDPVGLGLENYDPIGAWRTEDGLSAVDATGEFIGTSDDILGEFDGAVQMSQRLANSRDVAECLANQWFRFALGRIESTADSCTMQELHEGFAASNRNIRQLITQLALSDAFRHVRYANNAQ